MSALGSFIGRERALAEIEAAFTERGAHLVTLAGPPGIGKTRTAQRFLEGWDEAARGPAWFCDLREVRDALGLAQAVAALWPALGARLAPSDDVDALVTEHLRAAGPMLLVLDNFEQIASAGGVVRRWCEAARALSVVVTSRARLAVEGETVLELPPLACPKASDTDADVRASEAVRLFSARATAAGGNLGEDAAALGALVRRLDGLPLAIELVAAQTRVSLPRALVARMERRSDLAFSALDAPPRDTADRHATLTAALDGSWRLLSTDEQCALAECSVFAGSFTVEAAEHVVSPAVDGPPTIDRVAALRDKSLLHIRDEGRLAMYVSIREYAARRLYATGVDVAQQARLRHAHHYADAIATFNTSRAFQSGAQGAAVRASLASDCDNVMSAIETLRALDAPSPADVRALAELAIGTSLFSLAAADACIDALTAALALARRAGIDDVAFVARIFMARQGALGLVGRFDESRADLREALALPGLPRPVRAYVLLFSGTQHRLQSRYREAWSAHEEAERELATIDLPRLRATNWACMGRLRFDFGDERLGRAYNEQARRLYLEIDEVWMSELPRVNVAQFEQEQQNFALAEDILKHALTRFREVGEAQYDASYTVVLGNLYFEAGNIEEARRAYTRASLHYGELPSYRESAMLYGALGALEAVAGDRAAALAHGELAERMARRSHSRAFRLVVELLERAMHLHLARGVGDVKAIARATDAWRARARELASDEDVASSIDVRFAWRIAERACDASGSRAMAGLVVGAHADHFACAGSERVDLARRPSLRRILDALVEHHRAHPSAALAAEVLIACGWPGERVRHDAAGTRLRVAIATLRRLGLRDLLLTRDDGYLLDPAALVTRARASAKL